MMQKKRILFISLILFFALFPMPFINAAWLDGWKQREKITIDHNDVDNALSDFPVLIYISGSSGINNEDTTFIFDEIGANSLKIAITESDGTTECKVEIEEWDFGNEKAWIWVKVPSIASGADTDIYLYYDNDHADNGANVGVVGSAPGEAVWDNNFVMVQHLTGADAASLDDSTSNNHDVNSQGGTPDYNSVGEIAGAVGYVQTSNEYNRILNTEALKLKSDYTIEFWIKTTETDQNSIIQKFDESTPYQGWGVYFDSITPGRIRVLTSTAVWIPSTITINNGIWRYVVVTNDNANSRIFIDNIARGSGASANPEEFAGQLAFATNEGTTSFSDFILDEVRLSKIDRPGSWVKASYESGRDNLLDFGTEENIYQPFTPTLLFGAGFNSSTPYVELHWNHSLENVQFFEVQNSSDKISWDYLGQSLTTNYTDTQVLNGTERYYRIRACNQTGGAWFNSSFTAINFETVYFIPGAGPGAIVIQNVTGEWIDYNLTEIDVLIGVYDLGDVNSTLDIDGDTYNCSEVVGAPGFRISFNWTNVDRESHCLWIVAYVFYDGNQAHDIHVELYNFTSTTWVEIGIINDAVDFGWVNSSIYDLRMPNDFINSTGAVLGRFDHVAAGNINHDIHIEFLKLQAFIPFEVEAVTEQSFFWIFIAIALSMIVGIVVWLKYDRDNN